MYSHPHLPGAGEGVGGEGGEERERKGGEERGGEGKRGEEMGDLCAPHLMCTNFSANAHCTCVSKPHN